MDENMKIAWFAGLFEGEGTFQIFKENKPKAMSITSTDIDVLERVKEYFGGVIYSTKKREEHWKNAFVWRLGNVEARELFYKIKPFLSERRIKRGEDYISLVDKMLKRQEQKKLDVKNKRNEMFLLKEKGYTHQKIADIIGCERSYVSHVLRGKKYKNGV